MKVTVVAMLCHMIVGQASEKKVEVCHEEVVHVGDSMQECLLFPANLAQWKETGRFAGTDWNVSKVRCVPGTYVKRDEL